MRSLVVALLATAVACGASGTRSATADGDTSTVRFDMPIHPSGRFHSESHPSLLGADSLVLERTRCLGPCPAYRLSIARTGIVRFQRRGDDRAHPVQTVRIDSAAAASLFGYAEDDRFAELPDAILHQPAYCPDPATDNPTVTVRFFVGAWSKHIADDHSCSWAPESLRRFEVLVDSVSGVSRWR